MYQKMIFHSHYVGSRYFIISSIIFRYVIRKFPKNKTPEIEMAKTNVVEKARWNISQKELFHDSLNSFQLLMILAYIWMKQRLQVLIQYIYAALLYLLNTYTRRITDRWGITRIFQFQATFCDSWNVIKSSLLSSWNWKIFLNTLYLRNYHTTIYPPIRTQHCINSSCVRCVNILKFTFQKTCMKLQHTYWIDALLSQRSLQWQWLLA